MHGVPVIGRRAACAACAACAPRARGSILLTVLVMVSVLFMIATAVLSVATFSMRQGIAYGDLVRARWAAEGEVELLVADLNAGRVPLVERSWKVKGAWGPVRMVVVREDDSGRRYLVSAEAEAGGATARVARGLEAFFPTDYAVTVRSNWRVVSRHLPARIGGPVYVAGDLELSPASDGPVEFAGARGGTIPLLVVGGKISLDSVDGAGDVSLWRAAYDPYRAAPWRDRTEPRHLLKKGILLWKPGEDPEAREDERGNAVSFADFRAQYDALAAQATPAYRLVGGYAGGFPVQRVLNPRLLEKDLLTVADGRTHIFRYEPAERPIKQLYCRRVEQGQRLAEIGIDPVADADAIGNNYFTARLGTLHLPAPATRLFLQFGPEAYRELGSIFYGGSTMSYCSVDAPLSRFFVDTLGDEQRYRVGTHYQVDRVKKRLLFTDNGFLREFYYILPERGDGGRLGYQIPAGLQVQFVYVKDKLVKGWKKEGNNLLFASPPENGARIAVMTTIPKIFAEKNPPPAGVGLFADKLESCLRIDLSELRNYPVTGVIVADVPLYVTGEAAAPITIATTADVYLADVNKDSGDPHPVGIVAGGLVFVDNEAQRTNWNRRVFISTGGERIYTTSTERPKNEFDLAFLQRTALVSGSVHLRCEARNGYFGYPESLREPGVKLYTDEPFFSVQYLHDPAFLDAANLPPGIVPQARITRWTR